MDDVRIGGIFRAVRLHRRLRQEDVARMAHVSASSVSRIEHGAVGSLPHDLIRSVATALGIRLDLTASWRGGDLDRVVNARHSALHEVLADRLARCSGWVSEAEVSYSIRGEWGVIDRLAFHPARRMLAVFELKSDLTDPAGLIAQLGRYRRLAAEVARARGWNVTAVSRWALVADTDLNRRRLAAHAALIRGTLPADGRQLRPWLADPDRTVDGLGFIAYPRARTVTRNLTATKRVRVVRTVTSHAPEPRSGVSPAVGGADARR